jgi:DNA-binding response OmpR family regulator
MKIKNKNTNSLSGVGKLGRAKNAARQKTEPSAPSSLAKSFLFRLIYFILTPLMAQLLFRRTAVKYSSDMRILIIEDEHKIANAIKQGLAQENYAVDVEYDGDSGLGSALNESYDVMIIDRMLPGSADGVDIIREVRKAGIHTPLLMLTAKDQIKDRVEGLNAGADDYLVKPFSFEELLARVRALMRRPQTTQNNTIKVADLSLDTISYHVERRGKQIELSAKEFALLEYMMRNADRVLSKDNIISHVWDFDADILPNTVEVYIGYLRNKIDKPFDKPLLHTNRGFGYILGARS